MILSTTTPWLALKPAYTTYSKDLRNELKICVVKLLRLIDVCLIFINDG